jgi:hypothetical protein
MNNLQNNQNGKIAGVFKTEEAGNNFADRLNKLYNMHLYPWNCQLKKYKAVKDKKLISTTIKEDDYIIIIEGKKEDLNRICEQISFNSEGCYLSSEQMNSFELTDDWLLELL